MRAIRVVVMPMPLPKALVPLISGMLAAVLTATFAYGCK